MPLTGFSGTETEPNWIAASEQSGLLLSLQNTSPDDVVKELGVAFQPTDLVEQLTYSPDFRIVSSKSKNPALFDGTDGAPRYLAFYHNSQYWILILGSYTSEQWVKNCVGGVAQVPFEGTTVPFHRFWLDMAKTMYTTINAEAGDMGVDAINVAGHSLGAAVAYDLALLFRKEKPTRPVRVLTFGSPRPCRGQFTGSGPPIHYDVQTQGDVVVQLPPNLPLSPAPYWRIQGNPSVVKESGLLAGSSTQLGELSIANVRSWGVEPHPIRTYATWLKTRADAFGPAPSLTALLRATGQIVGVPIPVELRPPAPDLVGPDLGNPIAYRPLQVTPQVCR